MELIFIFVFVVTAAGVVPCGGPRKQFVIDQLQCSSPYHCAYNPTLINLDICILVICYFGFESKFVVLFGPVPDHCLYLRCTIHTSCTPHELQCRRFTANKSPTGDSCAKLNRYEIRLVLDIRFKL